jgi:xanthine dehydrogenase YagS FAD-binding subunit
MPFRAKEAEEVLVGRPISKRVAVEAAVQMLAGAKPLSMNSYKVEIARILIGRAIMGLPD